MGVPVWISGLLNSSGHDRAVRFARWLESCSDSTLFRPAKWVRGLAGSESAAGRPTNHRAGLGDHSLDHDSCRICTPPPLSWLCPALTSAVLPLPSPLRPSPSTEVPELRDKLRSVPPPSDPSDRARCCAQQPPAEGRTVLVTEGITEVSSLPPTTPVWVRRAISVSLAAGMGGLNVLNSS